MAKFNKLDVPHQWKDEFTKYPHGYTIFEALCKWTKQVDNMVDNVNDWNDYLDNFVNNFEFELQEEVQSTIERWQSEGLLDGIIESALDTELDNLKTEIGTKNQRQRQPIWSEFEQRATNVKWYEHLVENGDWTEAIQEAINVASVMGTSEVYIPAGTYNVRGLTLPSNITIQGAGKDLTTFVMINQSGVPTITNSGRDGEGNKNIHLADFTVDSNKNNRATTSLEAGIGFRYVDNFTIKNVYSHNSPGYGFDIWYSRFFLIEHCEASHCDDDGFSIAEESSRGLLKFCDSWSNNNPGHGTSNKSGFELEDGVNFITLENCRAWDNESQNFDIHTHSGDPISHDILFKNCESIDPVNDHWNCLDGYNIIIDGAICKGAGVANARLRVSEMKDVTIKNVTGEVSLSVHNSQNVNIDGINIDFGESEVGRSGVALGGIVKANLNNIIVNNAWINGIQLQDSEDITISNFAVTSAGQSGFRSVGELKRIVLNGGTIKDCGQNTSLGAVDRRAGIYFATSVIDINFNNIIVSDNQETKTQINGIYCANSVDYINLSNINCRDSGITNNLRVSTNTEANVNQMNVFS